MPGFQNDTTKTLDVQKVYKRLILDDSMSESMYNTIVSYNRNLDIIELLDAEVRKAVDESRPLERSVIQDIQKIETENRSFIKLLGPALTGFSDDKDIISRLKEYD